MVYFTKSSLSIKKLCFLLALGEVFYKSQLDQIDSAAHLFYTFTGFSVYLYSQLLREEFGNLSLSWWSFPFLPAVLSVFALCILKLCY